MRSEEQRLIEKLRRIEALFARPGSEGERIAAQRARERILARLGVGSSERASTTTEELRVEFRFSLHDPWSKRLLLALLQHHAIPTYRNRGQRRTTIRARVSRRFVDEVLWPQFRTLERELRSQLDRCTDHLIERALGAATRRPAAGDPR